MPKQKEELALLPIPSQLLTVLHLWPTLAPHFLVLSARGYLVFSEGLRLFEGINHTTIVKSYAVNRTVGIEPLINRS